MRWSSTKQDSSIYDPIQNIHSRQFPQYGSFSQQNNILSDAVVRMYFLKPEKELDHFVFLMVKALCKGLLTALRH